MEINLGLVLMIFFARVFDVSLGTLRIIFVARGQKYLAPLVGFVEVFIWIAAVSQVMRQANSDIFAYLGYAAGFAAGNYIGMWIEDKLAIGTLVLRTILPNGAAALTGNLQHAGYGVTTVQGEGANGPVTLVYTIIKRKDLPSVVAIIHQTHPKAFLTIEQLRSAEEGIFPPRR
jgi:uncharacterized protein YebE (UPF0316 family)